MDYAGSARQLQKVSFLTAISKLKLKVVTVRISNRSHGLFLNRQALASVAFNGVMGNFAHDE